MKTITLIIKSFLLWNFSLPGISVVVKLRLDDPVLFVISRYTDSLACGALDYLPTSQTKELYLVCSKVEV